MDCKPVYNPFWFTPNSTHNTIFTKMSEKKEPVETHISLKTRSVNTHLYPRPPGPKKIWLRPRVVIGR